MLRTIGRTCGLAIASLCLVSSLAVAQTVPQTLVCTKIDASGYCIEAKAPETNKMVVVRTEGVKVGEQISCTTTGTSTTCTKVTTVR